MSFVSNHLEMFRDIQLYDIIVSMNSLHRSRDICDIETASATFRLFIIIIRIVKLLLEIILGRL